jgi:hypothetical protein
MIRLMNFMKDDWKLAYALVVVYGYAYNIIAWGPLFWLSTLITTGTGHQIPAPPLLPWEHLMAATANLGVIGTIELFKQQKGDGNA